jgi:hypothetical protein
LFSRPERRSSCAQGLRPYALRPLLVTSWLRSRHERQIRSRPAVSALTPDVAQALTAEFVRRIHARDLAQIEGLFAKRFVVTLQAAAGDSHRTVTLDRRRYMRVLEELTSLPDIENYSVMPEWARADSPEQVTLAVRVAFPGNADFAKTYPGDSRMLVRVGLEHNRPVFLTVAPLQT